MRISQNVFWHCARSLFYLEGHNFGFYASLQLCCMICFDLMTGNPIIFWVLRNFFLSYLHINSMKHLSTQLALIKNQNKVHLFYDMGKILMTSYAKTESKVTKKIGSGLIIIHQVLVISHSVVIMSMGFWCHFAHYQSYHTPTKLPSTF